MSRTANLSSWNADWEGLKVLVVGLGVTGFSVADTLWELGCDTLVVAERASDEHRTILDALGVAHEVIPTAAEMATRASEFQPDVIVVSPGIQPNHDVVAWAHGSSIPVWSDIELAWRVRDKVSAAEWMFVTGTNGKTTTTQLTEHFLRTAGFRAGRGRKHRSAGSRCGS